jgi:3-deoxy-D-manno-octulosonic-acid transferase
MLKYLSGVVYNIVLYLSLPLVLGRLWWRGKVNPEYRKRWKERLGFGQTLQQQHVIWLHAVSVGETNAAEPLVRKLLKEFSHYQLLITTTTPTGARRLRQLFGNQVQHRYFPFDLPDVVHRVLRRYHPNLLLIMETEIWPNLLAACKTANIPVFLLNARLSERSLQRYRKLERLISPALQGLDRIMVRDEIDRQRFIRLGGDAERIQEVGNLKYALEIPADVIRSAGSLRKKWGSRPVWIAASTHKGEEHIVLAAHQRLLESYPNALLVLVPRHPERRPAIEMEIGKLGLDLVARSDGNEADASTQVYLADTLGELLLLLATGDVVFMGGSLVNVGGHNPLEPAALGLPVLTGPQVHNFEKIFSDMKDRDAVLEVSDEQALSFVLEKLFNDPELRQRMGRNARAMVESGSDVVERIYAEIITALRS